jgi:hypothetical protein
MPISSSDIRVRYSVTTGTVGNTSPGTAAGSHGRYISTTDLPDATLNNLFPDVTADENAAQNVDYKCLFVTNLHPTLTLQRAVIFFVNEVAGGSDMALALDNVGVVLNGQSAIQATTIANKNTVPSGVTAFSTPTTKATALAIGDIPPGRCIGVWVRRTARNSPAQDNDGATLRVEGDTQA